LRRVPELSATKPVGADRADRLLREVFPEGLRF
jgi:hypothetical protein